MAGLSEFRAMGNLARDAVLRTTQSGKSVVSGVLMANERYFSGGENKERTSVVPFTIWGPRGKALVEKECLLKGQSLYIEGGVNQRSWTAQDGTQRYTIELTVGFEDRCLQLLARRGSQVASSPIEEEVPVPQEDDFAE